VEDNSSFRSRSRGSVHCDLRVRALERPSEPGDQNKGLDFRSQNGRQAVNRAEYEVWLEDSDSRLSFVYDRIVDSNVAMSATQEWYTS
jgi:hypothetical protein